MLGECSGAHIRARTLWTLVADHSSVESITRGLYDAWWVMTSAYYRLAPASICSTKPHFRLFVLYAQSEAACCSIFFRPSSCLSSLKSFFSQSQQVAIVFSSSSTCTAVIEPARICRCGCTRVIPIPAGLTNNPPQSASHPPGSCTMSM